MTRYNTEIDEASTSYPSHSGSSHPPSTTMPHAVASGGFAQTFGLHPAMVLLTFIIDAMLFGAEAGTLGTIWPLSCAVAVALGFITYHAQKKWYGDEEDSALLKALILALLTAIPTALPAFLYVPAGVIGLFHRKDN